MKVFFSLYSSVVQYNRETGRRFVVNPYSGYAHAERELKKALRKLGVKIVQEPDEVGSCDVELFFGQPHRYPNAPDWPKVRPAVILTMFETSLIPSDWVEAIGKFDWVINPSKWGRNCFIECGIPAEKVVVLPLGFNSRRFHYVKRKDRNKRWVFLWRGLGIFDRKGWVYVEKAFRELNLPDSHLISKTVPQHAPETEMDLVVRPVYHHERWGSIRFVCSYLPWDEMLELMYLADVSVNPSSGEGWGLIPLEDAATGCCTILTDFSGYAEYSRDTFMLPLRYELKPSTYFRHNLGKDAKIDYEHLKELMLWTYEHRKEARELGWLSSKAVLDWDWDRVALGYYRFLRKIVKGGQNV